MLRYVPIVVVLAAMLYCFFDVLSTDRSRLRSLNKPLWLLVALLPVIGALLWLFLGRPRRLPSSAGGPAIQLRRHDRPLAPDDDPAFLKKLDEQAWRAKREARKREQERAGAEDGAAEPGEGEQQAEGPQEPTDEDQPGDRDGDAA